MKAFKYIILLLLILIIGGAVYFSLKDGTYDITESKVIEAPAPLIFKEIQDLQNWEHWNPRFESEAITVTMGNQTQGVDAFYTFEDESGNGKMTITGFEPDQKIEFLRSYDDGIAESETDLSMSLEQVENGTLVRWSIKGEQGLMEKFAASLFGRDTEKEMRPVFKQGLAKLESHLQKEMARYSINIDGIIQTGGGYYLYMSSSANMENLSKITEQMLQNIMTYMNRNNIDKYGMPMSIYEKFDPTNNSVIFSAAIPVKDRVITETDSNVLCGYRPPGKAVKVTLKGAYDHLEEAWDKGESFISQNGLEKSAEPPYEVYKTDPTLTLNPAAYRTEIYIPIK